MSEDAEEQQAASRIALDDDDGSDYVDEPDGLSDDPDEEPTELSIESRLVSIDERKQDERERQGLETSKLRRAVAWVAIGLVTIQLLASNAFFIWHMMVTSGAPSQPIMLGWMSTSVVEIIGILGIVAHSLFPSNGKKPKNPTQGKG